MKAAVDSGPSRSISQQPGHDTAIACTAKKNRADAVTTADSSAPTRSEPSRCSTNSSDLAGKTVASSRCPADTDRDRLLPAQARRPLHVRGQGQPEDSARSDIQLCVPRLDAKRPPTLPTRPASPSTAKLPTAHGRREQREIWTTTALNDYLSRYSPANGQALRHSPHTTAKCARAGSCDASVDTSWGVDRHTPRTPPGPQRNCCAFNRGHWTIENSLHRIIDDSDNWNEDNSRIRTGHGPENMTGLRRFAIGVIKMHGATHRLPPCAS